MKNPNKYLGNELKYVERILNGDKGWSATGGDFNHTLEQQFSAKFGTRFGITLNSGTSTLHAALWAMGVEPGDEVISPAFTVMMDAFAICHAGAVPVFADVDTDTFNISPEDIERKITPKTKAIIAVALYGLPPDMDAIMEIAKKHNLGVIEDNAQAFNPDYKLRGDFASYSFETTKHMSCGEGGMLVTNNKLYAERARKFAGLGYKNMLANDGRTHVDQNVFQNPEYVRHDTIGYNYRLSEFGAAIALAQFERLDELINMRKKSAQYFRDAMAFCDFIVPQKTPEGYPNSYYTLGAKYYPERNNNMPWEVFRREYITQRYDSSGNPLEKGDGIYGGWQLPYDELDFGEHSCPVAEEIQPRIMQFKTNYRDDELAKNKAEALYMTVERLKRGV